ncbi:sodium:solute symporter family protein [Salibacterium aidingense]|uniref:sodium:solute symporter family protein n=1 Tax=Salibacterium aidingense TaxID=384933 RepID=UPI003BEE0839
MHLAWGIILVLAAFVIISIAVQKKVKTAEDYWIMGRNAKWWMFTGTLTASYVSLSTFIGGVGSAWNWGPMPFLLFYTSSFTFGWIIAVTLIGLRMRKLGVSSISEYYKIRFGSNSKIMYAGLGITLAGILYFYLLVQIQGGGLILSTIFDISLPVSVIIMVVIVAFTLGLAGMWSVVITDTFAMAIFIIVAIIILPATISAVGGLEAGIGAISDLGGWSATGSSGLDMPYYVGYALAWLAIVGGSPHIINRSLIVDTPKSVLKGSFVSYVITVVLSILVFISAGMLTAVIEPGSIHPDNISAYAAVNVWPWIVGVLIIGGAMSAAFTTANTQALSISQGIVDLFRYSIKPDMTDNAKKKYTTIISIIVLIIVGIMAFRQMWLLVIAGSLAGIIASLGLFPTLILSLYWERLTLKAVNIMIWLSVPLGAFMIITNETLGWFAPFPTVYSFPIGFIGLIVISLLTEQKPEEKEGFKLLKDKGFASSSVEVGRQDYVILIVGMALITAVYFMLLTLLGII